MRTGAAAVRLDPRRDALLELLAHADRFDGCRTHVLRVAGDPGRFERYGVLPLAATAWALVQRDNDHLR